MELRQTRRGLPGRLLDLLFPPRCVFCGALLERGPDGICPKCRSSLPWLSGPAARQTGEGFSLCAAPLRYQDTVRQSFHRYKFQGRRQYAAVYGPLIAGCVRSELEGWDWITWVPLSRRRLRERGYDQALLLAQGAARSLGREDALVSTLRKCRHTARQSSLRDDRARAENVRGAYEVPYPEAAAGRRLLLVDDILTTGATLSVCAQALRQAGAADVLCAVLARAR